MSPRHRVSASQQSIGVGRDLIGSVSISHITNVVQPDSNQGLSTVPPLSLLPPRLRGRDELCAGIADLLAAYRDGRTLSASTILAGLGGVGKSAIALEVCRGAFDVGIQAFWINASAAAPVRASLWRVAHELNETIGDFPQSPLEAGTIDVSWRALETTSKRWLIVFDNADDPNSLAADGFDLFAGNGWLRASMNGLVIATSRIADPNAWPPGFEIVQLESLEPAYGADLLLDLLSGKYPGALEQRPDACALSMRLGGLPLALRAAGKYLVETTSQPGGMFANYFANLDSQFAALLGAAPEGYGSSEAAGNRSSVLATWMLSVQYLTSIGYLHALRILRTISCLDPGSISVNLLQRIDNKLPIEEDEAGSTGRLDLVASLRAMQSLGLVESATGGEQAPMRDERIEANATIQLHRLVSEVFGQSLLEYPHAARVVYKATVVTLTASLAEYTKVGRPDAEGSSVLAPHCVRIARGIEQHGALYDRGDVEHLARMIGKLADRMTRVMSTSTSIAVLETFLSLAQSVLRPNSRPVRKIMHSLAHAYWRAGEHELAKRFLIGSQHVGGRAFCRVLPDIGAMALASLHSFVFTGAAGDMQADLALRQLRTIRRVPWRSLPQMLVNRTNLARVLSEGSYVAEAEAEFRRLVQVYEQRRGSDHPETLQVRYDLATTLKKRGNFVESEQQFRGMLGIIFIGPESDMLGFSAAFELADVLRHRGDNRTAAELLERLLADEKKALGLSHPSTIATVQLLSIVLRAQERFDEAERLVRPMLDVGADPSSRYLAVELGHVLRGRGDITAAEAQFRAVVEALSHTIGEENSETLSVQMTLAGVLREQGQLAEAEVEYRKLLDIQRPIDPDAPESRVAQQRLADVRREGGSPGRY
jgi:tetratricopeptide (TPR) repeat protein